MGTAHSGRKGFEGCIQRPTLLPITTRGYLWSSREKQVSGRLLIMSTIMVSSKLLAEQDSILNATNWAGGLNLCEDLRWIRDGTHSRLVWKRDITKSLNLATVANRFNYAIVPNAHLAMVVQLTENDFWMMADSAW
jgi:hypothetical protein